MKLCTPHTLKKHWYHYLTVKAHQPPFIHLPSWRPQNCNPNRLNFSIELICTHVVLIIIYSIWGGNFPSDLHLGILVSLWVFPNHLLGFFTWVSCVATSLYGFLMGTSDQCRHEKKTTFKSKCNALAHLNFIPLDIEPRAVHWELGFKNICNGWSWTQLSV